MKMHEDARRNFDAKFVEILRQFRIDDSAIEQGWEPDRVVAAHISPENSETPLYGGKIDGRTMCETLFEIVTKDSRHVLHDSGCSELKKLCEQVSRHPSLRDLVTAASIREIANDSLHRALVSAHGTESFSDAVEAYISREVREREIWIPLADIELECAIDIGGIRILPIVEADIASASTSFADNSARIGIDWLDALGQANRFREQFRGYAAVVTKVFADQNRSIDIAYRKAEEVCAALCTLQPINVCGETRSYLFPRGEMQMPSSVAAVLENGLLVSQKESLAAPPPFPLRLSSENLDREWERTQLGAIDELLRANPRTPYQRRLLRAILSYANCARSRSPGEKLIFSFAALEALLLTSEQEPIQDNLGKRIAVLLESETSARKVIVKAIKDAYAIRSKFMHHGEKPDDAHRQTINNLLLLAYRVFEIALQLQTRLAKEQILGSHLDDLLISAESSTFDAAGLVKRDPQPAIGTYYSIKVNRGSRRARRAAK